jgi:hypothetical protein
MGDYTRKLIDLATVHGAHVMASVPQAGRKLMDSITDLVAARQAMGGKIGTLAQLRSLLTSNPGSNMSRVAQAELFRTKMIPVMEKVGEADRSAGERIWFDQLEILKGGYGNRLSRIKETCIIFLSINNCILCRLLLILTNRP